VTRPLEAGSGFVLGMFLRQRRARVVLGDGFLILRQHVHAETLLGMKMSVGSRLVIHTDQH
jgi:hypothetical protein